MAPSAPDRVSEGTPAAQAAPSPPAREDIKVERDGQVYVYKLPYHRMTPDTAKLLAVVVSRCMGRGLDTLRVTDDQGNDLLGRTVSVAYEEFRLIASYEGLG